MKKNSITVLLIGLLAYGGAALAQSLPKGSAAEQKRVAQRVDTEDEKTEADESLIEHSKPKLSFEQALAVARESCPQKRVKETELEVEQGRLVYSVEFIDETEFSIDAESGRILEAEHPEASSAEEDDD